MGPTAGAAPAGPAGFSGIEPKGLSGPSGPEGRAAERAAEAPFRPDGPFEAFPQKRTPTGMFTLVVEKHHLVIAALCLVIFLLAARLSSVSAQLAVLDALVKSL